MTTQEIQKRSEFIQEVKKGNCEVVEIGNLFGDCYVTGDKKAEAAEWLRKHTTVNLIGNVDNTIKKMAKCEEIFNVTVGTLY